MQQDKPEIGYLMKRVQQALYSALDSALKDHHLTMAQYAVLFNLLQNPGASSAGLARLSFVTPQTMMRLVKNLEQSGFLTRTQSSEAPRILKARLTSKGATVFRAATRDVSLVYSRMLSGIRDAELEQLGRLLNKMLQQLEESQSSTAI
jgi:DNA-binding MarR family transcriptional regulator